MSICGYTSTYCLDTIICFIHYHGLWIFVVHDDQWTHFMVALKNQRNKVFRSDGMREPDGRENYDLHKILYSYVVAPDCYLLYRAALASESFNKSVKWIAKWRHIAIENKSPHLGKSSACIITLWQRQSDQIHLPDTGMDIHQIASGYHQAI